MPHKDKEKAREYFAKRHKDTYSYEKGREYYLKNREKILANSRKVHLRRTYKLSTEEYDYLVAQQGNKCAICHQPEHRLLPSGKIKPLSVDHNHSTGEIRELLCNDCNAALGFSKENEVLLLNMVEYIRKHSKEFQPDSTGRK